MLREQGFIGHLRNRGLHLLRTDQTSASPLWLLNVWYTYSRVRPSSDVLQLTSRQKSDWLCQKCMRPGWSCFRYWIILRSSFIRYSISISFRRRRSKQSLQIDSNMSERSGISDKPSFYYLLIQLLAKIVFNPKIGGRRKACSRACCTYLSLCNVHTYWDILGMFDRLLEFSTKKPMQKSTSV